MRFRSESGNTFGCRMRIWKETYKNWKARDYDGLRHRLPQQHLRPALTTEWVYFVQVCSFTFVFETVEEIREYLDYYSKKTHPSTAVPGFNHGLRQTRFDQLPLYLREEPKRR